MSHQANLEQVRQEYKAKVCELNDKNVELSVLYAKAQEDFDEQTRVCEATQGEISRWQSAAARDKAAAERKDDEIDRLRKEVEKLDAANKVAVDLVKQLRDKYALLEDSLANKDNECIQLEQRIVHLTETPAETAVVHDQQQIEIRAQAMFNEQMTAQIAV